MLINDKHYEQNNISIDTGIY